MNRLLSTCCAALALLMLGLPGPAAAALTAHFVDPAFPDTQGVPLGPYDSASITVAIDPAATRWIAWSNQQMPEFIGAQCSVGEAWATRCLRGAMDDSLDIRVTRLSDGASSLVRYDRNDGFNNAFGPQNVIFGAADDAPDAMRNNFAAVYITFDEAGAQSAMFTTSGQYRFDFVFQNEICCGAGHPSIYLLVDQRDAVNGTPAPATLALLLIGGLSATAAARQTRSRRAAAATAAAPASA